MILFSHCTQTFTFASNFVFFFLKTDSQDSMSFMSPNVWDLPLGLRASLVAQLVKNLPVMRRPGFDPSVGKIPWRRKGLPT